MKMYFDETWPSGVKSFMVPITNTSDSLIGSGIFYRPDAFMMSVNSINDQLKYEAIMYENSNPDYRTQKFTIARNPGISGSVALASVSITILHKNRGVDTAVALVSMIQDPLTTRHAFTLLSVFVYFPKKVLKKF